MLCGKSFQTVRLCSILLHRREQHWRKWCWWASLQTGSGQGSSVHRNLASSPPRCLTVELLCCITPWAFKWKQKPDTVTIRNEKWRYVNELLNIREIMTITNQSQMPTREVYYCPFLENAICHTVNRAARWQGWCHLQHNLSSLHQQM